MYIQFGHSCGMALRTSIPFRRTDVDFVLRIFSQTLHTCPSSEIRNTNHALKDGRTDDAKCTRTNSSFPWSSCFGASMNELRGRERRGGGYLSPSLRTHSFSLPALKSDFSTSDSSFLPSAVGLAMRHQKAGGRAGKKFTTRVSGEKKES